MVDPRIIPWDSGAESMAPDARRHRLAIGIRASDTQLVGSVVWATGRGTWLWPRLEGHTVLPLPQSLSELTDQAAEGPSGTAAAMAVLTDAAASVVHELLGQLGAEREQVLLVAVHGLGYWSEDPYWGWSYHSLCDTPRLAAATGQNTWDELPAADLAVGGTGRNLEAAGLWLLLADRTRLPGRRIRALVEGTGRAVRVWLIPAPGGARVPRMHAVMVEPKQAAGPGVGGEVLEVAGEQPAGCASGRIVGIDEPERSAAASRPRIIAGPDVLCGTSREWPALVESSMHDAPWDSDRLAAHVAEALRCRLPRSQPVAELLVLEDGLPCEVEPFAQAVRNLEPALDLVRVDTLGWGRATLFSAAVAVLGLMTVDGWAVNPSSLEASGPPRLLGRFTPGTGAKWRRLVLEMSLGGSRYLPLRYAV